MSIPGGIRVKLSLALLGIVGGALLAAYVIVIPSLEQRLVEAKLDQMQSDAETLAVNYATDEAQNRLDSTTSSTARTSSRTRASSSSPSAASPGKRVLVSLGDSSAGRRRRTIERTRRRSRRPRAPGPCARASSTTAASTPRSPSRSSTPAT